MWSEGASSVLVELLKINFQKYFSAKYLTSNYPEAGKNGCYWRPWLRVVIIKSTLENYTCSRHNIVLQSRFLITYILSISLKFGICYITGQWDEFRMKNATYIYIYSFGISFLYFIKKFVFWFSFLMKCQIFATEY